jgi:hypothetical protein
MLQVNQETGATDEHVLSAFVLAQISELRKREAELKGRFLSLSAISDEAGIGSFERDLQKLRDRAERTGRMLDAMSSLS